MPADSDVQKRINAIRMLSIDAVQKANSGHPGLPLGAAPMAYAIWANHLKFNAGDLDWPDRDRFVLSAGHGSMLLYALLYLTGAGLTLDDLKNFRQFESKTPGHPESHLTPGVELTTGPLGQGVSNAVGFAIAEAHLAAVYNRNQKIVDHHTYVIASDGDLMEGVSAESASLAGHLRLGKLIVLYDDNHVSLAAPTEVTFTEDVLARYAAYGWHAQQVAHDDGNDVFAIDAAIAAAKADPRPSIIAVRTIIGYGSPRADTFAAHGEPLGADNVKKTKEFFGWPLEPDFYVPADVLAWWRERGTRGAAAEQAWNATLATWKAENPQLRAQWERTQAGELPAKLPWPAFTPENGSVATRDAGGTVMNAIAAELPEFIGGSADLDPVDENLPQRPGRFRAGHLRRPQYPLRHPRTRDGLDFGRHRAARRQPAVQRDLLQLCRLHETAGSAGGAELLESHLRVHARLGLSGRRRADAPADRATRNGLRATPNLATFRPADSLETLEAWKFAIAHDGPSAIVLTRQKVPFLGARDIEIGRGAYVLSGGDKPADVVLIATGSEVSLAVEAAKILEAGGTATRVVSMPSMDQFAAQDEAYRDSVIPRNVPARVSIEAGATFGWHRWIGERGVAIGIDRFGFSAPAADIAKAIGFTPEAVAGVASGLLAKT